MAKSWSPAELVDVALLEWAAFAEKYPERSYDSYEVKRRRVKAKDRAANERAQVSAYDRDLDTRLSLNRALRDLDKAKASKAELVAAVNRAVADNIRSISFAQVPAPIHDFSGDHEEVPVILFSDLQLAQVTASYNSDVAAAEVELYADEILNDIAARRRGGANITRAKLYALGDIVEGEMIFPGQAHLIDASLYSQVTRIGPRIVVDFIRRLLTEVDLDVVWVPGNHGDIGGSSRRDYNPETNSDRMLGAIVEQIFEAMGEERVRFTIPDGYGRSSFYAVDYVGETGFLLWHGHQARRMSNSSHLSFFKLVMGWRSGAIPEPFQISVCGHHHTPTFLTMNTVLHFINGTFASHSEYAQERLAANSGPAQWLLFVRPDLPPARSLVAWRSIPLSLEQEVAA